MTRFERAVEVFVKFFRTVELFETVGTGSTDKVHGIYGLLIESYRPTVAEAVKVARRYVDASRRR